VRERALRGGRGGCDGAWQRLRDRPSPFLSCGIEWEAVVWEFGVEDRLSVAEEGAIAGVARMV
jgi:hypothetical protein